MNKQEEGASPNPAEQAKTDALYDERGPKKIIRLITVMGYVFSVSFLAITLSSYYLFLWEPPDPKLIERYELLDDSEHEFFAARSDQAVSFPDFHRSSPEHNDSRPNVLLQRRIATDDDYPPDQTDDESFRTIARNKTMSMLRNTLVEILRARRNSSKIPSNSSTIPPNSWKIPSKSSTQHSVEESFPVKKSEGRNPEENSGDSFESITNDFGGGEVAVTLKINPTIISEVKRNIDGFHETNNDVVNGSFRSSHQRDRNSMRSADFEEEKVRGIGTVTSAGTGLETRNYGGSNVSELFPENTIRINSSDAKVGMFET